MATSSIPPLLTVEQAQALKAQAIALGKLGDLNNRVLRALVGGHNPAYTANYLTMWDALNQADGVEKSTLPPAPPAPPLPSALPLVAVAA